MPFDKNIVPFLLVELRWLNEKPYTWDNMEKKNILSLDIIT